MSRWRAFAALEQVAVDPGAVRAGCWPGAMLSHIANALRNVFGKHRDEV